MSEGPPETRGRTLGLAGVLAYFGWVRYRTKLTTAAYVLAGCAFGILSVPTALWDRAQVGVVMENPGGLVLDVLPGSQSWYDGIRPGQRVVALDTADSRDGWRVVATDNGVVFESNAGVATYQVRNTLLVAILAAGCALASLVAFTRKPRLAEAWAALSLGLGAIPLLTAGSRVGGDVAMAVAVLGPTIWVVRWHLRSTWARSVFALGAITTVAAWIAFREIATDAFGATNVLSTGIRLAILAVPCSGFVVSAITGALRRLGGLRSIDITAAAAGLVLVVSVQLWAPWLLPAGLGVVLLGAVLYPRGRTGLGELIDHLVIIDLRERASLEATEEERARLARDLHDVPLQELSGVIRRMELQPELQGETGPLRQIADELRAIATALRPPVLEDLGLAPALETLAANQSSATIVHTSIDNQAGYRPVERGRLEVEVAVFRAAQEAVRNAVVHGSASAVTVSGSVSPVRIAIDVTDDGVGLSDDAVAAAMRQGRLGLPSMRRRIASIGGTLEFARAEPGGLVVRIRWNR